MWNAAGPGGRTRTIGVISKMSTCADSQPAVAEETLLNAKLTVPSIPTRAVSHHVARVPKVRPGFCFTDVPGTRIPFGTYRPANGTSCSSTWAAKAHGSAHAALNRLTRER